MKRLCSLTVFLALLIFIPLSSAGTVTRSFQNATVPASSVLAVMLSVDVDASEDFYALEERYPDNWTLVDSGGLISDQPGFLKIAVIQNAADTQYTYLIRSPASTGNYTWDGYCIFEGMEAEQNITGDIQVTVSTGCPDFDGDNHTDISCGGDDPDDSDITVYPGAPELCDGKDNDGDGSTDEGCSSGPPEDEDTGGGGGSGGGCIPEWSCTGWRECQTNDTQTRECSDSNSCGTTQGKPDEIQDCDYLQSHVNDVCQENWICGEWSVCTGGVQARSCEDHNHCQNPETKPDQTQACEEIPGFPVTLPGNIVIDSTLILYAVIALVLLFAAIIIFKTRTKRAVGT